MKALVVIFIVLIVAWVLTEIADGWDEGADRSCPECEGTGIVHRGIAAYRCETCGGAGV